MIISSEVQNGLSAANIASIAGLAKSSIFHHFKNMDEIILSSMALYTENIISSFSLIKVETFEEFLAVLGSRAGTEAEKNKELAAVAAAVFEKSIFNEKIKELFKGQIDEFLEIIDKKIIESYPNISKKNRHGIALLTSAACEGLGMYLHLSTSPEEFKSSWDTYSRMCISYLSKLNK